jgi:hypothetical protein
MKKIIEYFKAHGLIGGIARIGFGTMIASSSDDASNSTSRTIAALAGMFGLLLAIIGAFRGINWESVYVLCGLSGITTGVKNIADAVGTKKTESAQT